MDCQKITDTTYRVSLADVNSGATAVQGFSNRLINNGASYNMSSLASSGTGYCLLGVSFIPLLHLDGVDFSELGPF